MLAVVRKRNFTLLWLGQVVSLCGDAFLIIAVPYYVYQLTGSVLQTGITFIVQTLPRVLLSSLAGVFVDRWNRRWTMIIADLLRAVVILLMLLVHSADLLWLIYVALAAQAIISQFFTPASMALIPSLVEEEQLMAANSFSSLGQSVTRLIGPPLGGLLFTTLGLTGAVLMDSVTYVFSALMLLLIALPAPGNKVAEVKAEQKERIRVVATIKHVWEEWIGGLQLIGRSQTLIGIFLVMAVLFLGQGIIQVMFVVFVRDVMHGDAMIFAWVIAAQGVGSILGAFLNSVLSKWLRPVYQIALAGLFAGTATFAMIFYPDLILVLILTGLMGIFVVGFVVTLYTLLQVGAEDSYRGRVFGTLETVMSLSMLISMTLSSSLGDSLGVVPWMTVSGVLILLSGFVALLTLRQARLPQSEKQRAEEKIEPSL